MSFDLTDYATVAEREEQFFAKYPEGRIQVELEDVRRGDGEITAWKAKATVWRSPDDPLPVVDFAVEPVPGKTPYTRDSEAMNASTSAVGRAIVLAGFPTKKLASAEEVLARQSAGAEADGTQPSSAPVESPVARAQAAQEAARAARAPADNGIPENVELTFGKFKGQTLGSVPRDYLEWLVGNYQPKTPEQQRVHMAAQLVLSGASQPPLDDDIPF